MVLDEVESHLYRGHSEVVRAKIEYWQMQLLHDISSYYKTPIEQMKGDNKMKID